MTAVRRWRRRDAGLVYCLLILHSPDDSPLVVQTHAITALKPVAVRHHDHLPEKTGSVVYIAGSKSGGFAVRETISELEILAQRCGVKVITQKSPPK